MNKFLSIFAVAAVALATATPACVAGGGSVLFFRIVRRTVGA